MSPKDHTAFFILEGVMRELLPLFSAMSCAFTFLLFRTRALVWAIFQTADAEAEAADEDEDDEDADASTEVPWEENIGRGFDKMLHFH